MANADPTNEDLNNYDSFSRSSTYYPSPSWNLSTIDQLENMQHNHDPRRHISPIRTSMAALRSNTLAEHSIMEDNWQFQPLQQMQQHHQQQQHQHQHHHHAQQNHHHSQHQHHAHQHLDFDPNQNVLDMSFNTFPDMTMQTQMAMIPVTHAAMPNHMSMDQAFLPIQQGLDSMAHSWPSDLTFDLVAAATREVMPVSPYQQHTGSPTGSHLEVLSQGSHMSSNEDGSWTMVDPRIPFEQEEIHPYVVPGNTLHDRGGSLSESSSDFDPSAHAFMTGVDIGSTAAVYSPTNLSDSDCEYYHLHQHAMEFSPSTSSLMMNNNALTRSITIPPSSKGSSPVRSPASQGSAGSPGRKPVSKKSPISAKSTDRVQKKSSTSGKNDSNEKRVGKRKGPLKPEQRKQASEIRKLRACIRCKFLKKTCDKGEPCAGCQPSHARLWQVPCTRIDIKEIGYFLKDKKFDFERHLSLGFSISNIKAFSEESKIVFITHGYGHMLPVSARGISVHNENCLKMDWMEANRAPDGYEVPTAGLSVSSEGISTSMLSEYLDSHINTPRTFERFVDEYFEGTPFLSQMLKVAFKFYDREKSVVIKKALKLMLAYCLTVHITMVEGLPVEEEMIGKISDRSSKFYGKTMAPVMINFQIKCAMADMWRELHKDVLEELSSLYSSVYSGDKLKNWPTIFILASVLLAVWECMQFDCHYRVPDESAVDKFCNDMEQTPVGVIVGLFSAISQKLPSILEWDSSKHGALLGSNQGVCDTMTEVRQHVSQYESYLRDRPNAKFDSKDFDSLSNKFLSRLVLRDIRVG